MTSWAGGDDDWEEECPHSVNDMRSYLEAYFSQHYLLREE